MPVRKDWCVWEIAIDLLEYPFEPGFTEDEVWSPEARETFKELDIRTKKVLDMLFDNDEERSSVNLNGGL